MKPAVFKVAIASSSVWPRISGILTVAGPLLMIRTILLPCSTCEPMLGLQSMTLPYSIICEAFHSALGETVRPASARILLASATLLPTIVVGT